MVGIPLPQLVDITQVAGHNISKCDVNNAEVFQVSFIRISVSH